MHIQVQGSTLDEPVRRVISDLTNHAQLDLSSIHHDEQVKSVSMVINRAPASPRRFLPGYSYGHEALIPATLRIHKVESVEIRGKPDADKIDLLFGLKVEGKQLYACSVSERRGEPCFEIEMEVAEFDIELEDAP